jgi:hypothetical protein
MSQQIEDLRASAFFESAAAVERRSTRARRRQAVSRTSRIAMISAACVCLLLGRTVTASANEAPGQGQKELEAYLQSGEFGSALAIAQATQDPSEKTKLVSLVARAQWIAGEFQAARKTARHIPALEARIRIRAEAERRRQSAGGGSGADFTQLIDLIQTNTGDNVNGGWVVFDNGDGTISEYETGVRVDPNGLLYRLTREEQAGRLAAVGARARAADLHDEMARTSPLRIVSLTRLERAVAERLRTGEPVLETMRHLAGLSRIQYVFIDPSERELIIAGPAEGWRYRADGLAVGINSGRPTLQLDDLVTVLRTFSDSGAGIFGCSINPRAEGLKAVKEFVEASPAGGRLAPAQRERWLKELQSRMGLQDIEIYGVPASSRVGQVLVEADYRMKLIGIGQLDGGKEIPSIFDLLAAEARANPPALDALRWWLTMKYDAVLHSSDRRVFEIQGSAVRVQSEDQLVTADGQRVQTGKASETNRQFARNFTEHYAALAKRDPAFAELQNIFDLGMVAALCEREQLATRIGWDFGAFSATGEYTAATVPAPRTVDSVMNHRIYRGRELVVQVAGGVRADFQTLLEGQDFVREAPALQALSRSLKAPNLPAGRWWWDASR